jgi:hypothetical protein
MALPRGFAPRTSAFAKRRAELITPWKPTRIYDLRFTIYELAGIWKRPKIFPWRVNRKSKIVNRMVSVIGLAPIRSCLKGRVRGLLCIHGRNRSKVAIFDLRFAIRADDSILNSTRKSQIANRQLTRRTSVSAMVFMFSQVPPKRDCGFNETECLVRNSKFRTPHSALNWSPGLVARQRLLLFREALICLSYPGELAHRAEAWRAKAGLPSVASCEGWSSHVVTLHGLPVISRALCF